MDSQQNPRRPDPPCLPHVQGGRIQLEWVAGFSRNRWPDSLEYAEVGRFGANAALTMVESPLSIPSYKTPFQPLTRPTQTALRAKLTDRTMTRGEYERYSWDRRFTNRRGRGVDRFWSNERQTLRDGGEGTRHWTPDQRNSILQNRRPRFNGRTVEGHHRYNALDHPQLADDPGNIYPATRPEHLHRWHGSNYRNDTFGGPLNPFYPEQFGSLVPPGGLWWLGSTVGTVR